MPSLRRSFSSPSVRSSPYPSAIPSSIRARATPRRSSGSATAERRVLADIEWWRVHDGQCDLDPQDQSHQEADAFDGDVPLGGTVTLSAGGGSLEPPQTPLVLHNVSLDSVQYPLAVLSVAPYSPSGSRHGRDSSVESPELSPAPLETVQLGRASSLSCPLGDSLPFPPSLTRPDGRQVHHLFGFRSISAPGLSYQTYMEPHFADMGGDSFSLDQNLFQ